MGLLQNFSILNSIPLNYINAGVSATAAAHRDRSRWNRPERSMNWCYSYADTYDDASHSQLQKSGVPNGYAPPYQYVMPMKDGCMSAFTSLLGEGSTIPDLRFNGDITAGIVLGSGGINYPSMLSSMRFETSLSGYGQITTSPLNILAWCLVNASGVGDIPSSNLLALAPLTAGVTASGYISNAVAVGLANLIASIAECSGIISSASMAGGMRLETNVSGIGGIVTSPLTLLAWCLSDLEGEGDITLADLLAPFLLVANLGGQGAISEAAMTGIAVLLTSLEGVGGITTANLKIFAVLLAALAGSGNLEDSILKAIAWSIANIISSGSVTGDVRSKMYMQTNITSAGEIVTAQSCAIAVWTALANAYNDPGTMGNKMNSASAAGDPWTAELPSDYVAGSAGEIISRIGTANVLSAEQQIMLVELYKILGLDIANPLVVTSTTRTAGAEIQQTITGDPDTAVTVTRQP